MVALEHSADRTEPPVIEVELKARLARPYHVRAALCWADRKGRPLNPLWQTADFGYVRLHEGRAKPWPRYGRAALASWQTVLAVETQYMRYHIPPATPKDIIDATNDYIKSLIALGDANTREVSDSEAEKFIADTRSTGDRLTQLCRG